MCCSTIRIVFDRSFSGPLGRILAVAAFAVSIISCRNSTSSTSTDLSELPWMLPLNFGQTKTEVAEVAKSTNVSLDRFVERIVFDANGRPQLKKDENHWRAGNFLRDSSRPEISLYFRDTRLHGIRVVHAQLSDKEVRRLFRDLKQRFALSDVNVEAGLAVGEIATSFSNARWTANVEIDRHPEFPGRFICDYVVEMTFTN
jgi:hypothetical protein